ncbi:MAG TPA: carbamoyltransferase HypF [Myxococcales bacterium LLY-WYZ-16_1]|nr:carbamoyltransferase HypF [Myxococcales bacterium LLY-WYZ-16_1]
MPGEEIRIRGVVQGVGFRPTVARLARRRGLRGFVRNDSDGVLVAVSTRDPSECSDFLDELLRELPPLARITSVDRTPREDFDGGPDFRIESSPEPTGARTQVPPDAATCPACLEEVFDPMARRFRYPFATCTRCGPRYTIAFGVPFDRNHTTMASFDLCEACLAEYDDETDRRYHAQAMACHRCGPRAVLRRADGRSFSLERYTMLDAVDAVATLLKHQEIVAVKGIGGYHLCCDATTPETVHELRRRKGRGDKPFAMMARDLDVVRAYARVSDAEAEQLTSAAAPIVLLKPNPKGEQLLGTVAPNQRRLGFMLPSTPVHHLMLRRVSTPIVCTSGNPSEAPPCIEATEAAAHLSGLADWFLDHDRPIRSRSDDSLVRVSDDRVETLRRARGLCPGSLPWPRGLEGAPPIWAAGSHMKATFTLTDRTGLHTSTHLGDLDHPLSVDAWGQALAFMRELHQHEAAAVAVDMHPEYRSTQLARQWADGQGVPVVEVQHHHAHVAAVMVEHGHPAGGRPVLGIALDGLGMGPGRALWGGEFLLCRYDRFVRLATFKPVALLGGDAAAREPWRNLLAHLRAEQSWGELETNFGDLEVVRALSNGPKATYDSMLASSEHAPPASSCGRLFDAVAAAVGLRGSQLDFEGQAAMELEAAAEPFLEEALQEERYPIGFPLLQDGERLPYLEPLGMWRAILGDLHLGTEPGRIAARFHVALGEALVRMAVKLHHQEQGAFDCVALAGGCFVNQILTRLVRIGLEATGLRVWTPVQFPAHDGGLSLGQAAVAAAQSQKV